MADNLLKLNGLTLHYGGSQILHGVDLDAAKGEVTCVMGTNGVGKTSLLKAISGTHARSGGTYALDGEDIGRASAHALAQKGVAYVPQVGAHAAPHSLPSCTHRVYPIRRLSSSTRRCAKTSSSG